MSMTIDAHVHLVERGFWPPKWFDFAAHQWVNRAPGRKPEDIREKIEDGLVDPGGERLLEQLAVAGIDHAVIFMVDWALGMESEPAIHLTDQHQRIADVVATSNGKLSAFAGVDPRRPDALTIVETALETQDMRGLKFYPPAGFYPYAAECDALYRACAERGVPVAIHTGVTLGLLRPRFSNPLYIQDVQRRHPDLTIWIAHSGATYWWDEAVATAHAGIDTYLELSSWQELAAEDEELFVRRLGLAINTVGPDRLLYASDHISGSRVRGTKSLVDWVGWFRDLPVIAKKYGVAITDEHVELILGGNAARSLGLDR
jgi:predicted TIM-barrel fold metal-dependent hydrolase